MLKDDSIRSLFDTARSDACQIIPDSFLKGETYKGFSEDDEDIASIVIL